MKNLIPLFIKQKFKKNQLIGIFPAFSMYVDLRGFTAMTEKLIIEGREGMEILTEMMNKIYKPSVKSIYGHGGFISTFAGDAFTSIFIADQIESNVVMDASLEIHDLFKSIGEQLTRFGKFHITSKIGISYGDIKWQIIKNDLQNNYFFFGDCIDGVIESYKRARTGEIIVDKFIYSDLDKYQFDEIDNDYFKLIPGDFNRDVFCDSNITEKNTNIEDNNKWISKTILSLKISGEFREIIPCFIFLENIDEFPDELIKIINLTKDYGGYLNKIDYGDKGWMILVLFGAPVGVERIYERACDFALSVKSTVNLKIKFGMTYGMAYCGFIGGIERSEYTALGFVVNLSARFAQNANWGGITIDQIISEKIKNNYSLSKYLKKKFKGFSEDIIISNLKGRKKRKILSERQSKSKLVGREYELSLLNSYINPIKRNKFGGIVSIFGDAGIGKTRLVNEFRYKYCHEFNWFHMPCDEILRKPFNPLLFFLNNYFQISDIDEKDKKRANFDKKITELIYNLQNLKNTCDIVEEIKRTKTVLGALIGLEWKSSLYENLDAKGKYENTLFALKNLIKAESLLKPVIIEVDDVHWIDDESKGFLEFLIRNVENYPFIIIAEYRSSEKSDKLGFKFEGIKLNQIELSFLRIDSVVRIVKNIFSDKLELKNININKKTLNLIWDKSEGNPFYLEQVVLYLIENKLIDENFKLIIDNFEIPSSINMIITARIDRLTSELRGVVNTAAILGREFDIDILEKIFEKLNSDYDIQYALVEIEKENIWEILFEIKYIFKHALIRESIYNMQLRSQLRKIHGIAAEVIEELHEGDNSYFVDIADHYEKAENYEKAKKYLELSAEFLKSKYQNSLAIHHYNKLLQYFDEENESEKIIKIILKKNHILKLIGKWKEAEYSYKKAITLSKKIRNKKLLAKSLCDYASIMFVQADYKKALEIYHRTMDLYSELGDEIGRAEVSGNLANVYLTIDDYSKAMELYGEKLKIDRKNKNTNGISRTIGNMGIVFYHRGEKEKAIDNYEKSIKLYEDLDDKLSMSKMLVNAGIIYIDNGQLEKALESYNRSLKIKQDFGDKRGLSVVYGNLGNLYQYKGDISEAEIYYLKSLEIKEELGERRGICVITQNMGRIYRHLKDLEKSQLNYDRSIKIGRELGLNYFLCGSLFGKAELCYEKKEYSQADNLNNEAKEIAESIERKDIIFSTEVFQQIISYRITDNSKNKEIIVKNLENILTENEEIDKKAIIYYELFKITEVEHYGNKALKLYKDLFKINPDYKYAVFIEDLTK